MTTPARLLVAGLLIAAAGIGTYFGIGAWAKSRLASESLDTTTLTEARYAERCMFLVEKAANSAAWEKSRQGRPAKIRTEMRVGSMGQRSVKLVASSGDGKLDEALVALSKAGGSCGPVPVTARKGFAFQAETAFEGEPGNLRITVRTPS